MTLFLSSAIYEHDIDIFASFFSKQISYEINFKNFRLITTVTTPSRFFLFFMDSTQNSCGLDFTTRHVRSAKKILNSGVGLGFDIKASLAIQRS